MCARFGGWRAAFPARAGLFGLSEAVLRALQECLEWETERRGGHGLREEIARMQDRIARLPLLDERSNEEILRYDARGLTG